MVPIEVPPNRFLQSQEKPDLWGNDLIRGGTSMGNIWHGRSDRARRRDSDRGADVEPILALAEYFGARFNDSAIFENGYRIEIEELANGLRRARR